MIDENLLFPIKQENHTSILDDYVKRFPIDIKSTEELKKELAGLAQRMSDVLSLKPSELLPGHELNEDALKIIKEVAKNLKELADRDGIGDAEPDLKAKSKKKKENLLVSKIELFDIRCFQHLDIKIKPENQLNHWIMLLGDNAIGKSTILKSIALGLCNESDAAALIKASETQGDFIRQGAVTRTPN